MCGCYGQCLGLVVMWFLGLVVAWWLVSCGCCGGFLVVLVVAVVFGGCPSGYGVVGFDLGLILSLDSHHGCDWCLVGFLVVALWVLWVEVVVDFMGFVPGGRVGFFHGGGGGGGFLVADVVVIGG